MTIWEATGSVVSAVFPSHSGVITQQSTREPKRVNQILLCEFSLTSRFYDALSHHFLISVTPKSVTGNLILQSAMIFGRPYFQVPTTNLLDIRFYVYSIYRHTYTHGKSSN
jgi:hypothetical protein